MRYWVLLLIAFNAYGDDSALVRSMGLANGFQVSDDVVSAIVEASRTFGIPVKELTAIGILETGLGKYHAEKPNKDGTIDQGIFQVNTVNVPKCLGFDLNTAMGSAYCAAKLLRDIKGRHASDYLGRYHSKTPSRKTRYQKAVLSLIK